MAAFTHHFGFEFRTGIRNRTLLFMNYLFPLTLYLMLGFIMPGINPLFKPMLIPVMVVIAVLASTILGLPEPLVSARERGIFRSYKINGVPSASIIVIPAFTTLIHTTVVALIIVVTAPLLFDAPLPANGLAFALAFLAIAPAGAGLGSLIGVVSPDNRATVLLSQLIFLPSMLIGGMMIPYAMLPASVQTVARLLPTTYAMALFDGPAMGGESLLPPVPAGLILGATTALAFGLAIYLFSWDSKNAGRRGHPALALLALLPMLLGVITL